MTKKKALLAAGITTALAITLTGCTGNGGSGGGGGAGASKTNCTNEIKVKDVPVVTYWGWFEDTAQTVDNFNESHDDVQICWTNAGQGADAYTKLSTSLQSKSGGLSDKRCVESGRFSLLSGSFEPASEGNSERV